MNGTHHSTPEHFQFLLVENFSHLAFSCAVEPLRIANLVSKQELYRWCFASENGEFARASNGSETRVAHTFADACDADTIFVLTRYSWFETEDLDKLLGRKRNGHGRVCSPEA